MIRAKVELFRAGLARHGGAQSEARGRSARLCSVARETHCADGPPHSLPLADCQAAESPAVARAIAPYLGPFPGAVHVRSDAERKRLFGFAAD